MEELYIDHGTLVPKEEWDAAISTIRQATILARRGKTPVTEHKTGEQDAGRKNVDLDENEENALEQAWQRAFQLAIKERVDAADGKAIGVLFSGGLDSTLIAHALYESGVPFTCYTVGFQDSGTKEPEDIVEARRTAQAMGWRIVERVYTLDEMETIIARTAGILGDRTDNVSVGVGSVIVAGAQLAANDGVRILFSGLGSEEIFAGYERHELALQDGGHERLEEECWRGLAAMHEQDLKRDTLLSVALGIAIPTPFLDPAVIKQGMLLAVTGKIVDGQRKLVLRRMAINMGLPTTFAMRPKRAAQYGSRTDAAIERLARKAGYESKGSYVRALINTDNPDHHADRPTDDETLRREHTPKSL
ncbi:TPA: asparagine synthase [Candidatus Woesearchaeota archaeon]|nr:asparagine synthase [Candidatus Woesearchaeota archaeon]